MEKATGICATLDEITEAKRLANKVPQIFSGLHGPNAQEIADPGGAKRLTAQEYVHQCALKHGLPEIKGFYGMSGDGEFLVTEKE